MKLWKRSDRGTGLEFDLNIIPIIDCFTILITFMLASGVYISIAVLDVGVSAGGKETTEKKEDTGINLSVRLAQSNGLQVLVTGRVQQSVSIPSVSGTWDFRTLGQRLQAFKAKHPDVKLATVVAGPEIAYQDVVRAMDTTKKTHPDILLGGF